MATFEEGFKTAEAAAESVLKSLNEAAGIARQLRKASQDGNIAAVKRQGERLDAAVNLIRQEIANASTAWPFTPDDERQYLEKRYGPELQAEAQKRGLQVFERDGRLIAHPSVVRVLPGERAVRIDRRQTSSIRPSKLVADLERLQKNPPRSNPQQFLQALYEEYLRWTTARGRADELKMGEVGLVLPLMQIYSSWTGRPGSAREYTQLDFARDLYALQESGIREVISGPRVSFPASTGTRSARSTISFVGPGGEPVTFYGIQFTGAN